MDSDSNSSPSGGRDLDFGFAFNDSKFSDRVLRIEIVADPPDARPLLEGCHTIADCAAPKSKRRRVDVDVDVDVDVVNNENALDSNNCREEQILDCQQPDVEDGRGEENHDEKEIPVIEDSPSVGEAASSDDSNWSEDGSRVLRIKTLHISSAVLAAQSPFFYKLFSNGMIESELRHVTVRITSSEEAGLMELLNFMYSSTLKTITAPALLEVLMAADKFEVASCMRYCSRLLRNLPMTPESALLYLDLPSSLLMADAVQPLTDAGKQFLAARYRDILKYRDEVMNLPLAGIEAILASDDVQVPSEDDVCEFVLCWTRTHYPKLEERRDILCSYLGRYIRFPYMSCKQLRKVLTCNEFDRDFATTAVNDALFFKAEAPYRRRSQAIESTSAGRRFVERAYKFRPIKVIEFELPRQKCVVYLDLKREECEKLFPSGRVYSHAFHLGGQVFFLSARCTMDQQQSFHRFGLFLWMQKKGSVTYGVDYEFAAWSKATEEYVSKFKGNCTFTDKKSSGYCDLFRMPWTSFMDEDCLYFINGILHLRATLTIT